MERFTGYFQNEGKYLYRCCTIYKHLQLTQCRPEGGFLLKQYKATVSYRHTDNVKNNPYNRQS